MHTRVLPCSIKWLLTTSILFSFSTTQSQAWDKSALKTYSPPRELPFENGYDIVPAPSASESAIKQMPSGTAMIAAYLDAGGRRYYMTDWSYDRYNSGGIEPNWIRPSGTGSSSPGGSPAVGVAQSSPKSGVRERISGWAAAEKSGFERFINVESFHDGLALVDNDKYVNTQGRVVFSAIGKARSEFSEGFAIVSIGEDFHVIDTEGNTKLISTSIYNPLVGKFHDGLARLYEAGPNGDVAYIDTKGRQVFRKSSCFGMNFSEGLAILRPLDIPSPPPYYVDKEGSEVVSQKGKSYRFIWDSKFSDGLCCVMVGTDSPVKGADEVYGFIDRSGKLVFSKFGPKGKRPTPFSEGIAWVESKWNDEGVCIGLNGFNKDGKSTIQVSGEKIRPFSNGLAALCRDGLWGYVDHSGKEIVPPIFPVVRDYSDQHVVVLDGMRWRCFQLSKSSANTTQSPDQVISTSGLTLQGAKQCLGQLTRGVQSGEDPIFWKVLRSVGSEPGLSPEHIFFLEVTAAVERWPNDDSLFQALQECKNTIGKKSEGSRSNPLDDGGIIGSMDNESLFFFLNSLTVEMERLRR